MFFLARRRRAASWPLQLAARSLARLTAPPLDCLAGPGETLSSAANSAPLSLLPAALYLQLARKNTSEMPASDCGPDWPPEVCPSNCWSGRPARSSCAARRGPEGGHISRESEIRARPWGGRRAPDGASRDGAPQLPTWARSGGGGGGRGEMAPVRPARPAPLGAGRLRAEPPPSRRREATAPKQCDNLRPTKSLVTNHIAPGSHSPETAANGRRAITGARIGAAARRAP